MKKYILRLFSLNQSLRKIFSKTKSKKIYNRVTFKNIIKKNIELIQNVQTKDFNEFSSCSIISPRCILLLLSIASLDWLPVVLLPLSCNNNIQHFHFAIIFVLCTIFILREKVKSWSWERRCRKTRIQLLKCR